MPPRRVMASAMNPRRSLRTRPPTIAVDSHLQSGDLVPSVEGDGDVVKMKVHRDQLNPPSEIDGQTHGKIPSVPSLDLRPGKLDPAVCRLQGPSALDGQPIETLLIYRLSDNLNIR